MDILTNLINEIIHIANYLIILVKQYGVLTHVVLFSIIFLETGLVITPFLPGGLILFVAGALAGIAGMNIVTLLIVAYLAAILGDTVNYQIGKRIGNKVLKKGIIRFISKKYLTKDHMLYEKYGSKTIVIGRFIPIIRTFIPFISGIGRMKYSRFIIYNILGVFIWVTLFLVSGYFFGNLLFVKQYFLHMLIGIIIILVTPLLVIFVKK